MTASKVYIKNAQEIVVVEEAKNQLAQLDRAKREEINLTEVIAFVLNRLPCLYASSDRGWLQQKKRANNEFRKQAIGLLHQAFLRVGNNPLVRVSPLPLYEIERPDYCLRQLREILRRPNLTWKEVPSIVQESITQGTASALEHLSLYERRRILETKNFIRKSKEQMKKAIEPDKNIDPIELQEFNSYMMTAEYQFVNVLERPVIQIVEYQLEQMKGSLARPLEVADVAVYILNRFPAMYATNARGFQQQRERVRRELINDLQAATIQAILELSKTPRRLVGPLPFVKFEREHEQALENLKEIFKVEDLTCGKAVELVSKAVVGKNLSNRIQTIRSNILQELIASLPLSPNRHDLEVDIPENDSQIIFRTNNQDTFWAIVDRPQVISRIVLETFPETSGMQLQYQRLPFPLILTKHEMEEEVINDLAS
ncbi:MAG: late competence development ComFB family protein [Pseudanabaenaceae cyanobacterium SKYGB_i_bin29]|nr:late competence development ComFB family protein [Pseudanabaenaceae cyanobacterium SKYG29]MDW8421905.1 late competence development ComFB family protein [Pseudanabaenaceae cyanobacterium SKYGB_i_bin29]